MSTVDARGLSCPEPVLLVKKWLKNEVAGEIKILVDEMAACENVSALAKNMGWEAGYEKVNNYIEVILRK